MCIRDSYYHVVFTVPEELNSIIYSNQKLLYDALYHAASATLNELAKDAKYLGANIGYILSLIHIYNVLFIMELVSGQDIWSLEQWENGINNIYMKDLHNWCKIHFVKYHTVFVYRKEYPVKANIWNWYSYIRWLMERMMNLG